MTPFYTHEDDRDKYFRDEGEWEEFYCPSCGDYFLPDESWFDESDVRCPYCEKEDESDRQDG